MSLESQGQIRCPNCGKVNDVILVNSISATEDKDLKEKLLHSDINMLICSNCHARAIIPTPLLYTDSEKKLLFSYYQTDTFQKAQEYFKEIEESSKTSNEIEEYKDYTLRFMYDYNSLLEKILIKDAGLCDKTIEVIKLMVLLQEPETMDKRTAFFGKKHEDGSIEIMVKNNDDNAIFTSKAPYSTYDTIKTHLALSGVKEIEGKWEIVDINYAKKLLEGVNN